MDRTAAVSRIQQTLGFRSDKSTEIINALQDVQVQLEESATLPWFLLTEIQNRDTVADEERVPLPVDFLQEYEEDPLWYFNGTADSDADKWVPLAKDDLQTLREAHPGSGAPEAYHLDKFYYRIFPTPDDIFTLKHIFYKKAAVLTTDIENVWLEHVPFLLIGMAGLMLSETGLSGVRATAIFSKWETEGHARMLKQNQARMHSSRRYIMGGPD